jgi:predicted transcriptional regulator
VLHRGLKAGQELGGIVVQFISKILRLLGRKVEVGMDVSVVFIGTVFKALQQRLTREVNNAFNSLRRED